MKSDRELLELAAKAYGVLVKIASENGRGLKVHGRSSWWNPLTDDGDALRLAVELDISVTPYPIYSKPRHSVIVKQRRRGDMMREVNPTEMIELYGDDPAAATRRAIVRTAASIGEAMP